MNLRLGIVVVALGCSLLPSCSKSNQRAVYHVTGSVTMGGKPIETGSITFDPADGQGTSAMGGIEKGQFTAEVPPGDKILRISAVRVTDKKDQYGSLISESYIPAQYNLNSQLKRTVSPNEKNKFDLSLE
jgi:hypothetical protein